MPAAIAVPLITGALTTGATLYAANKSSGAARNAARQQTDAANHAADVEAKTAADQLAYEKQQAAVDQQNFQATQTANYNQYASRQRDLGSFGAMFGLPSRTIAPPPTLTSVAPPATAAPGPGTANTLGGIAGVTPATSATPASSTVVQMRAPDGTVKPVPASAVDHYLSLGATRVN